MPAPPLAAVLPVMVLFWTASLPLPMLWMPPPKRLAALPEIILSRMVNQPPWLKTPPPSLAALPLRMVTPEMTTGIHWSCVTTETTEELRTVPSRIVTPGPAPARVSFLETRIAPG